MSTGTTGLTTPPRLGRGGAGTLASGDPATGSARRRNPNRRMRWAGLLYLAPALAMYTWVVLVPLVWGLLRKEQGLPMFGAPTVAELEGLGDHRSELGSSGPGADPAPGQGRPRPR